MSGMIQRKEPVGPPGREPEEISCSWLPVFRHPFFRSLRKVCYTALILMVFPGCLLWPLTIVAFYVFALCLAAIWGFLGLTTLHGHLAHGGWWARRKLAGQRFLCPKCLQFGGYHYGCGACGEELERFVVHTGGCYLNDCHHCHAQVYGAGRGPGNEPRAFCDNCGSVGTQVFHERTVRVAAVLRSLDLDRLHAAVPGVPESAGELEYLRLDNGQRFTYILLVGESVGNEELFTSRHAAREVEALWLRSERWEPLALAEALDRFIRRARLNEARRKEFPVYVDGDGLDPAAREQLFSRFPATRFGISAAAFLSEQGPQAMVA